MLATNSLPAVKDQSDGFWRRVVLVPFTQSFKGDAIDPNLERDLAAELPGIAAWAVRGAVEWYASGLQVPDGLRGEVDTYRQSADRLGEFIATRLALDPGESTKAKDVWLAYKDWLRENDEDGVLRRSLVSMLGERPGLSLRYDRTRKQEFIDGCRVLTSTEARMVEAGMRAA
jgi:putative DNA primase/helicase